MKVAVTNSRVISTMVFFLVLAVAPASLTAREQNSALSKKELKVLLKTAKTSTEHRRIASHYRQEAQRLSDRSRRDAELAAKYEKEPPFPALEAGKGIAFSQGVTHYGRWAKFEVGQAERAKRLAALHESMAQKAEEDLPASLMGKHDRGERQS